MNNLIKLSLSGEEYKILDQMLVQASGYPIKFSDEKLGFHREKIDELFKKVITVSRSSTFEEDKVSLYFSREEVVQMMRAFALAFIETGPSTELSTVTGYSPQQLEEVYNKIDGILTKSGT